MNRAPLSGSVIVTGAASRSKTADEYSVSRFGRTTVCHSIGMTSRRWWKQPMPPASLIIQRKYMSVSARLKLSGVTIASCEVRGKVCIGPPGGQ